MNGDDLNLRALGAMPWTQVVRVGTGEGNDLVLRDFSEDPHGVSFALDWRGRRWAQLRWKIPGLFNARNAAMAACAAGLLLHGDDPTKLDLSVLARFRGVKRRQEILHRSPALTVVEDFGHHPTALHETLVSLRSRFPGHTLTAVFEPRSNTARTKVLQGGFTRALAEADEVYLGAVNRAEKLAEGDRFDSEAVAQQLEAANVHAHHFARNAEVLEALRRDTLPPAAAKPRLVVFFSNGSFDGVIAEYAKAAQAG
jgi:UDP-N-acetylmuramate: L-alanyl-gamma-D-glutamyl-meso-diaminopimelate ligase